MVLAATTLTLAGGLAVKQPCTSGNWTDGRQYRRLCYSDIVPLLGTEQLQGDRLPYLDTCEPASRVCDEYPVLTMYFMRLAAWVSSGYSGFFYANVFLLSVCALITAWALHRMAGGQALYFALAPTLLVYAFVNWDLLAVVLATGATLAYLRQRDRLSGALLGLGAAAKLYPGLLLVPLAMGRIMQRRPRAAGWLTACSLGAYAAVNLPFAVLSPEAWGTFFRFNAERPADWDSLWFVACSTLERASYCAWSPRLVNVGSVASFLVLSAALWMVRRSRDPGFPAWTFGFPLLVAFLLTNKVYSPQYGLWLLPWFALALPNPWLFAAFEVSDVAVFLTRFTWFGRLAADSGDPAFAGFGGVPLEAFQVALLIRAAVLILCLVAWTRGGGRGQQRRLELDDAPLGMRPA